MTITIFLILFIGFIASLVRSTLGFGESLIAVPLFSLFIPVEIAVPLSVMLSIVIALIIILQDHRKIHFHSARWLILYAIPGIPLGVLFLLYGNEILIKSILGLLIIIYAIYSLVGKNNLVLSADHKGWLFTCGFLSGVFGGAYGLNGPPLVVYGHQRRWDAARFRATLQAYFLPVSVLTVGGYFAKGLVTTEVTTYFGWCLIPTIPAIFIGRFLNHRLADGVFYRYVYAGLIGISIVLIGSVWF